jgi:hypothetical protein
MLVVVAPTADMLLDLTHFHKCLRGLIATSSELCFF